MIEVRRYEPGDEKAIREVIIKDSLKENIKDYSKDDVLKVIEKLDEQTLIERAKAFHAYVLTNEEKIVGVGMVGPYWDSLTESSFFTIFIDPEYIGQGLGRKIIEALEQDEYYIRADRIEIPASITAVEFYKHFGYGFKKFGNIVDKEGVYRMEKYPKISYSNVNENQYNMRPYIDNEYHDYKEFVYRVKKDAYINYIEKYWGSWNEEEQRKRYQEFINTYHDNTWIIELNGKTIGFYNGENLEDGSYEIGNICIIPEYQGKGIGTAVLKDILELHKNQDIHIQYFKDNPVGKLYEKIGFTKSGESEYHYQMIKNK